MTVEHEPAEKKPEHEGRGAAEVDILQGDQGSAAGTTAPTPGLLQSDWVALQARLDVAQAKAEEHYDALLRARAEAENIRRRAQEDVSKARKFAIESFAESMLPVKDSLEAALAAPEQSLQTLQCGVETTLKQLVAAFERHRLLEIAPQEGTQFDPHQCQALVSAPAEQPINTVVETLQKGYRLADRVLRPALVRVSSGPPA
jgi:molecular chaperone GrpE